MGIITIITVLLQFSCQATFSWFPRFNIFRLVLLTLTTYAPPTVLLASFSSRKTAIGSRPKRRHLLKQKWTAQMETVKSDINVQDFFPKIYLPKVVEDWLSQRTTALKSSSHNWQWTEMGRVKHGLGWTAGVIQIITGPP